MLVGKLNAKKLSMDTKWIYIEMSDRYSKPMHTHVAKDKYENKQPQHR